MSFIYSQALEAVYSEANCLDTEQSAPLSGSHTPKLSLSHDKTMDASRLSRFGMTCRPLTESRGAELLTWWLAGFHARTSPSQEKAQESTEPGLECGDIWRGWLAKFDPDSSSWRTAQRSLIEDSGECLETFPRSGMTRGGLLWELPTLERPTSVTGFGFWPTPTTRDRGTDAPARTGGPSLGVAVRMWPTPTAHNAKETNAKSEMNRNTPTLAAQAGGALNPNWVEWLMGWPIGHTALKPSETVKFQPAPQPLGELLEGLEA